MDKQLSQADQTLYQAVDEVLHYIWDPIGVSSEPLARDEYYEYLPRVFSLLKSDADKVRIAAYLGEITTGSMGLSANAEHDLTVAKILANWKEAVDEKFA
jgi:hypothetical protein